MTERYSRREFLTLEPLRRLVEARSHADPNPEEKLRDTVVERIGEGIAFAAILSLAYTGSRERLVWFDVSAETKIKDSPEFAPMLSSLDQIGEIINPISASATDLDQAWKDAYLKTRIVPKYNTVTSCDQKGNCTTSLEITYVTEAYWDEPDELVPLGVNNNLLSGWADRWSSLAKSVSSLKSESPSAFNLGNGPNSLYYPEHSVDTGDQVVVAGLGYGIVGSAFIFYEEVGKWLGQGSEIGPLFNEEMYIKRRTFLKMAASLLAFSLVRKAQRFFSENNWHLLDDIKEHTVNTLKQMEAATPDENFQRYFGKTPRESREGLAQISQKTEEVLTGDHEGAAGDQGWPGVRANFESLNGRSAQAIAAFDQQFNYNPQSGEYTIPEELNRVTKYLWASREITNYVQRRKVSLSTRHLLNALVLGGGLGLVSLLGEWLLFPVSNAALEWADSKVNREQSVL